MTDVTYRIIAHDGGFAYSVGGTISETFASRDEALAAARRAAGEQQVPGADEAIGYQDRDGVPHEEIARGDDRPQTSVKE